MRTPRFAATLLPLAAFTLLAQNAPNTTVVDNELVRILKVTDEPGRRSALHKHDVNRVMVYLDAGHMKLNYEDGKVDDQNVKAGEVRWSAAGGRHTSENVGGKPVRIVEIELKGKPKPVTWPALDPVKVAPGQYKVEFENDQVRVVRARYSAFQRGPLHEHGLQRVNVFLTRMDNRVTPEGGQPAEIHAKAGDAQYGGPAKHSEQNLGDAFEVLVIDLKMGN